MNIEKIDQPAAIEQLIPNRPITNLMYLIWRNRRDLQQEFSLYSQNGQDEFINWFDAFVNPESGISRSEATQNATGTFDFGTARTLLSICLEKLLAPASIEPYLTDHPIANWMHLIWHCRSDSRQVYDIQTEAGQEAFLKWIIIYIKSEYGFPAPSAAREATHLDYNLGQALLRMCIEKMDAPACLPQFQKKPPITRRMWLIWVTRKDLQTLFDLNTKTGQRSFHKWYRRFGMKEYSLTAEEDMQYGMSEFDPQLGHAILNLCQGAIETPAPIDQFRADRPISKLMLVIWQSRKDLQQAFDLNTPEGQADLFNWHHTFANDEYGPSSDNSSPQENGALPRNWGQIGFAPPLSIYMLEKAARASALLARKHAAQRPEDSDKSHALRERLAMLAGKPIIAVASLWRGKRRNATSTREVLSPTTRQPNSALENAVIKSYGGDDGVNLIGYIYTESGVGEHVRMTATALEAVHVPYGMVNFSKGVPSRQNAFFDFKIQTDNKYKTNLLHINTGQMLAAYLHFGKEFFAQRFNIFYPFWELSTFPREWSEIIQLFGLEDVWAPSTYIQTALTAALGKPVPYMPVPIVLPEIPQLGREHFGIPSGQFLFLSTFDFYSYIDRKNPWAVVAAFKRAFPLRSEKVGLIIKVMNVYGSTEKWERLVREIGDDPRIRIINEIMDKPALLSLKTECDCYVSLHRAEGLGMGPMEAMLLGKPVILTNYSGSTDYAKPDNACLVDYTLIPVLEGQYLFHENQIWADPDVEHAAWYMKKLADDHKYGASLGKKAADYISEQYSPARCGHLYRQRLEEVAFS